MAVCPPPPRVFERGAVSLSRRRSRRQQRAGGGLFRSETRPSTSRPLGWLRGRGVVVQRWSRVRRSGPETLCCVPNACLWCSWGSGCSLARRDTRQLPGHGVTGLKHTGGRPGPSGRDGDTHVSKRAVEREIDVRDRLVHVEAQGLAVSVVALHGEECQKEPKRRAQPEIRTLPKTYRTH